MVVSEAAIFESVAGLPLHPLVVHVAVVILPLSALALIAIVLKPSWRRTYGWLVLTGLAVGAVAAFVAKQSGEALAETVGLPQQHADYGDVLPLVAILLLLASGGWAYLTRSGKPSSVLSHTLAAVAVVLALVAVVLTVLTGHTGAEAAWGDTSGLQAASTGSSDKAAAAKPDAVVGLTMAEIAAHATPADCWTAVDGNAYDVTEWIAQHPGGSGVIEGMCGVDATAAFDGQHAGQRQPKSDLASFLLGPVVG